MNPKRRKDDLVTAVVEFNPKTGRVSVRCPVDDIDRAYLFRDWLQELRENCWCLMGAVQVTMSSTSSDRAGSIKNLFQYWDRLRHKVGEMDREPEDSAGAEKAA